MGHIWTVQRLRAQKAEGCIGVVIKEEPKRSLAHLCMCYYYISLHNNTEIIFTKSLNKLGNKFNVNVFDTLAHCHFGNVHTAGVTKTFVVGAVVLKA